MISKLIFAVLMLLVIITSGCVQNLEPIGGQRDDHGCLGPAGYTWSADANSCIREWELNENQVKAAKIAVDHVGYEKAITIIGVTVARCPGCFSVTLEKGIDKRDRLKVQIENWEAIDTSMTPEECTEKDGEPLNTVDGSTCAEDRINIGEVTGFISPNICCKKISNFDECIEAGNPALESDPMQCIAGDKTFVEDKTEE